MAKVIQPTKFDLPALDPPKPIETLHDAYQALIGIDHAASFVTTDVLHAVFRDIRRFFLAHGMGNKYGLALLHKHFNINPDERLVEHGPCSTPWKLGSNQDFAAAIPGGLGYVVPRSYRFVQHAAFPYEFAYSSKPFDESKILSQAEQIFFVELSQLLECLGLDNLFGVRDLDSFDKVMTLEVTQGRNNVMIPDAMVPDDAQKITAMWQFCALCDPVMLSCGKGGHAPAPAKCFRFHGTCYATCMRVDDRHVGDHVIVTSYG